MEGDDADGSLRDLVDIGLVERHDPSLLQSEAGHCGPDAAQFAVEVVGHELDAGLHGQRRRVAADRDEVALAALAEIY